MFLVYQIKKHDWHAVLLFHSLLHPNNAGVTSPSVHKTLSSLKLSNVSEQIVQISFTCIVFSFKLFYLKFVYD